MVTGVYGLTALSIAKKIGIVQGDEVLLQDLNWLTWMMTISLKKRL